MDSNFRLPTDRKGINFLIVSGIAENIPRFFQFLISKELLPLLYMRQFTSMVTSTTLVDLLVGITPMLEESHSSTRPPGAGPQWVLSMPVVMLTVSS